jgi:hypothetical protein
MHCFSFIMIVTLMKYLRVPQLTLPELLTTTVLFFVPFHAFITIWASTLVGHYTVLRLWDDVLVFGLMIIACIWLARESDLRKWFFSSLLVRLILGYVGLVLLLGFVSYARGDVTVKALAYGVLIDVRFFAWFLVVLLTAQRSPWLRQHWKYLLLVPAAAVVLFGSLQYVLLPHQFLAHFGYNSSTIAPIETINHNEKYIRVQSTLRGANPLGAYIVVILAALAVMFVRPRRKMVIGIFGVIVLFALYASGSRSAWIGAFLACLAVGWFTLPHARARLWFGVVCSAGVVIAATGFLVLRNNVNFQNAVLHTQSQSTSSVSSNAAHASALSEGVREAVHQPLGDGPGTAGPASEYNGSRAPRIAEDYYVQIAQETGWLGLAIFLAISYLVGAELYLKAASSPLALAVFAAYIGVLFVNLLSHAWTDGTLAYVWWGFAAIALAKVPAKKKVA